MGLDVSHGCWSGAYSAFMRWRQKICEVAGYGDIESQYWDSLSDRIIKWDEYRTEYQPCPDADPLHILLGHCDCEGEIRKEDCARLADALEKLMPALKRAGDGGGHIGSYAERTQEFIYGLRRAAEAGEKVTFH